MRDDWLALNVSIVGVENMKRRAHFVSCFPCPSITLSTLLTESCTSINQVLGLSKTSL